MPSSNEDQVKDILEELRIEHHQARHICYAYRFGIKKEDYRANDDGEPSNSAGAPILGQIQSFDLTDVLIVVIRYYGGVKLGVGGLINAYREAAKDAVENGEIITLVVKDHFKLFFEYSDMAFIMDVVKESEATITNQVFEDKCLLEIEIPFTGSEQLIEKLKDFPTLKIENLGTY